MLLRICPPAAGFILDVRTRGTPLGAGPMLIISCFSHVHSRYEVSGRGGVCGREVVKSSLIV